MFKRRKQLTLGHKILGFFWPSMGWRRSTAYFTHRLARLPGTSYTLAGGFACGAAMSFTPFVGLHFVLSAILAWILRANIVASLLGTAIGNPWTFPFIWTWLYQTGTWMTSGGKAEAARGPIFSEFFGHMMEALLSFDLPFLLEAVAPVLWPMLVSSVPTGFVIWWIFYLPLKYMIKGYQKRRARKLGGSLKRNHEGEGT